MKRVSGVIEKEEANFFGTIDAGLNHIDRVFDEMRRDNHVTVNGAVAAELYQTYGVPPELFESLAAEHNFAFDWQGYEHAMEEHGEVSGKVQHAVMGTRGPIDSLKQALHSTEFLGYEKTEADAVIKGIIAGTPPDDHLCDKMEEVGHKNKVRRCARSHAVLWRERRPGGRHRQARRRWLRVQRDRYSEGWRTHHSRRPPREGRDARRGQSEGGRRYEAAGRHSTRTFGNAYLALRAAEELGFACAATGLEGR